MTPPRLDEGSEREAFEAYMRKINPCVRLQRQQQSVGGQYRTISVERAWDLWLAARAALSTGRLGGESERRCSNCDDTGDVHSLDGVWRGICHCSAGDAIQARAPAAKPQGDSHE